MARIERIFLKEAGIWNELDSLALNTSKFAESKRGISFISSEGSQRFKDDEVKGFCHKRYKANFVISGVMDLDLRVGKLLQIGKEAIVKITRVEKDCLPECPIMKDANVSCRVNKEAFFGTIVKEGFINKRDQVMFI